MGRSAAEKKRWLDDPRHVTWIYRGVWILCGLSVLADRSYDKHGHYPFEEWLGFHGWYGFLCCVLLALTAGLLRRLVRRDEDYYD
ncbi:MAG: hypothetical protein GY716_14445 [bacterium]|nr:hypothetical protein [bacterium]